MVVLLFDAALRTCQQFYIHTVPPSLNILPVGSGAPPAFPASAMRGTAPAVSHSEMNDYFFLEHLQKSVIFNTAPQSSAP
jgi:hypothetical protein